MQGGQGWRKIKTHRIVCWGLWGSAADIRPQYPHLEEQEEAVLREVGGEGLGLVVKEFSKMAFINTGSPGMNT